MSKLANQPPSKSIARWRPHESEHVWDSTGVLEITGRTRHMQRVFNLKQIGSFHTRSTGERPGADYSSSIALVMLVYLYT